MHTIRTYHTLPAEAAFLRRRIFMEEQGFRDEFDETDRTAAHLVLFGADGAPLAVCRYFPGGGSSYLVGRLAVRKDCRVRGLGAELLREAERQIAACGGTEVRLAAQTHARSFYEQFGYAAEGDEFPEEHCPHIWMRKTLRP